MTISKSQFKTQKYEVRKGGNKQVLEAFVLTNKERLEISTLQHHLEENSSSSLLIKAVLFGDSRFNFQGKIKIEKKAQNADASQKIAVLLMSERAEVKIEPFLEIDNNEVRGAHGASIGKIEEGQLFYLQSRGLNQKGAEKLLVEAFLKEVIDKITDRKKRSLTRKSIWLKLNKAYA